jgi:hypothetical protein
VVSTYPFYH